MATALTAEQAAVVKGLLIRGDKQHDIAAFYSVNSGRVAAVKSGRKHGEVKPALAKDLPSPDEISSGFALWTAERAIKRAMIGLETALQFVREARS